MGLWKQTFRIAAGIALGLGIASSAQALPGQTVEQVTAWINSNPSLRPAVGDGLLVQRSNSPSQRFIFEASVFPPGLAALTRDRSTIRMERYAYFDQVNGVTQERLVESLRTLYGLDIYQDYDRSRLVYAYPTQQTIDLARRRNLPLLAAQQGELRLGDRFGYWWEVTNTPRGKAFNGRMTIFLREDLDQLEIQLRNR